MSLMSPALAGRFFTASTTWEANVAHLMLNVQLFPKGPVAFPNPWRLDCVV